MNVGATSVTDYGLYFQWGDIQGYTAEQVGSGEGQKYFDWSDYKYSDNGTTTMTKYNNTDGKEVLDVEDDSATAAWSGPWRMPTTEEFVALRAATTAVWTTDYQGSGVSGVVLTDKTDSSKILFLPAAGNCDHPKVFSVGSWGYYWSSSRNPYILYSCYCTRFTDGAVLNEASSNRYYGYSVRPVMS